MSAAAHRAAAIDELHERCPDVAIVHAALAIAESLEELVALRREAASPWQTSPPWASGDRITWTHTINEEDNT